MVKKLGWKDIPIGGKITKAGSSIEYETGSWRTFRPVLDKDKCINCMRCWLNCPDMSIRVKDEKMIGFDYDFCKGCGLCAKECPVDAIKMILESEKQEKK